MPQLYQLTDGTAIIRTTDGAQIPDDPTNTDYMDYQAWVAAGNVADPYVPPVVAPDPVPTIADLQAQLAALTAQMQALVASGAS